MGASLFHPVQIVFQLVSDGKDRFFVGSNYELPI
jgi:hypothetical protein